MKPKQLLLLILALWINIPASAYDALVNGIYYNLSGNEATVTYKDTNYGSYSGGIVIPKSVSYNGTTYSVTSIGRNAFYNCSGLTSITIPNSVTSIGSSAFSYCSGLTSITIPNSVTSIGSSAFYDCSGLTSITVASGNTVYDSRNNCNAIIETSSNTLIAGCMNTIIPNSVTSIGGYAFRGCSGLTSITIPNSVTSIGSSAFSYCSGLTSITIPESVTSIGDWAFSGCSSLTSITIPNSVTSIGKTAFYNCSGLTSIIIPEGITSIGNNAFNNCSGLTSITIPNSVTSIGYQAFYNCSGLTSITIPNSVTSIVNGAFFGCSGLTSVVVENPSPVTITSDVFSNRANATLIVPVGSKAAYEAANYWKEFKEIIENAPITFADANVKAICVANWDTNGDGVLSKAEAAAVTSLGQVFRNNSTITSFHEMQYFTGLQSISNYAFYQCSQLTSVTLPSCITSIGERAFSWTGLTSIDIPQGVTTIGTSAFDAISNLASVTIPNSVTEIGPLAFWGCSSLTDIAIPNSVTSISNQTFQNCSSLTSVTIPNSVISIGDQAYQKCTNLVSVVIGDHVTQIGRQAFEGCSQLLNIAIPQSVTSIGIQAFANCSSLAYAEFTSIEHLCSINFGSGTSNPLNPAQSLYINGETVTDVVIPNTVTSIGNYAFHNFSNMSSITIPNTVTSIGDNAFQSCSGLTSITIPSSVTSIGNYAFSHCTGFTSMKVGMTTPLEFTTDDDNRANATLYVPAGSKAAYEAADYWKEFKRIIESIEGDVNGDGEMDVVDVVDIARYVVGTPAETFVQILADINNNGEVNLGDAVSLVNMIAGDQNFVKAQRAPQRASEGNVALTLEGTDGMLSLAIQNTREYTAFQFDLYVPEATDVTSMLLNAQRKQRHHLLYNKVEDGHWRVAAISTSNCTFNGYEGELLRVAIEGIANDDISIRNIRFFDTQSNEYAFDDICLSGTTTNLEGLTPLSKAEESVYDLQGRKVTNRQLTRGIYIVNGKKVVRK